MAIGVLAAIAIGLAAGLASRPALKRAMIVPAVVFKTTLPVDAVAITPDGKFVLASVNDNAWNETSHNELPKSQLIPRRAKVYVWSTQTQKLTQTLTPRQFTVWGIAVSPDGTKVALDEIYYSSLWDIPSGRMLWKSPMYLGTASFSPDGKTLRFLGYDFDIASQTLRRTAGLRGRQSTLTVSPDQTIAATIDEDYQFTKPPSGQTIGFHMKLIRGARPHLWDRKTTIERYELPYNLTKNIAFSPDGRSLALISDVPDPNTAGPTIGSILRMTNVKTQAVLWRKTWGNAGFGLLRSLVFSPSGRTLAVEDFEHRIFLIDAQNGRLLRRITPYNHIDTSKSTMDTPTGLAFSGDGKLLVSRADDVVCVWNTEDVK